jgi:hypothetical protein
LGFGVVAPVRIDLTPAAGLRGTVRIDATLPGNSHVTWLVCSQRAGEATRGGLVALSAAIGPEVRLPIDGPVVPYAGAAAGLAVVHTWHNIERVELMDPASNNLDSGGNWDPFSQQLVFLTDFDLGATAGPLWFELGYTGAFVYTASLKRSTAALEVQREAYGWNAPRLGVGISIPLGG